VSVLDIPARIRILTTDAAIPIGTGITDRRFTSARHSTGTVAIGFTTRVRTIGVIIITDAGTNLREDFEAGGERNLPPAFYFLGDPEDVGATVDGS